jgi:hypothetical protein
MAGGKGPRKWVEMEITPRAVLEWAMACVEEWFPGYTDVLGDGRQRKLVVEEVTDEHIIVGISVLRPHGGRGPTKKFKITMEVVEADGPAGD